MSIKPFILSYSYIFLFCLHLQLKSVYDQQLTTGVSHLGILKEVIALLVGITWGSRPSSPVTNSTAVGMSLHGRPMWNLEVIGVKELMTSPSKCGDHHQQ